jgi:hypothetical protein
MMLFIERLALNEKVPDICEFGSKGAGRGTAGSEGFYTKARGMTHLCLICLKQNGFKAEKEAREKQWKEPET